MITSVPYSSSGDRLREVVAGGRERGRVDRELLAFVLLRGAPDDEHVERLDDLAAAVRGGGAAGDQLRLVGVVVKHLPDAVQVELRERPRHRLRDTVADRIRVSDTLPLDDLDLLVLDRSTIEAANLNVPVHYVSVLGRRQYNLRKPPGTG